MTMKLGKKRQRTKLGLPLSANYKNMWTTINAIKKRWRSQ
jgi:hypothetical protein